MPAKKRSLRDVSKNKPTPKDLEEFQNQITAMLDATEGEAKTSSDRAYVISMGAFVEYWLERSVIFKFKRRDEETVEKLLSDNGAMRSFSTKISLRMLLV